MILNLSHGQYLQLPPRSSGPAPGSGGEPGQWALTSFCPGDDADSSVALGRAAVWQGCGFVNSTVLCKRTRRCGSRPQLHRAAPALARRRVGCPPPTVHTENHRFEGAACCSQLSAPTHLSPPFVDRVQSLLLTGTTYLCIMLTKRASGPSGQAPASTLYKARIYLAAFDDGLRHNV